MVEENIDGEFEEAVRVVGHSVVNKVTSPNYVLRWTTSLNRFLN